MKSRTTKGELDVREPSLVPKRRNLLWMIAKCMDDFKDDRYIYGPCGYLECLVRVNDDEIMVGKNHRAELVEALMMKEDGSLIDVRKQYRMGRSKVPN